MSDRYGPLHTNKKKVYNATMAKSKSQERREKVLQDAQPETKACPNCGNTQWDVITGTNPVQERCAACSYVYTPE
jgi:4-hydroxy-3-methylbut-2-en-1-yl diphosphate synthase IspG/GcpE